VALHDLSAVTAAGLVAAMPAVIAFNYFMSKIRIVETEFQSFTADFLNIIERDILKRPAWTN
jgi:biopolymer transport protein TolQ